jgi:hypothetical protein
LRHRQKIVELEGTINTDPSNNAQYCQKNAMLEGTKNTSQSTNSWYRQKITELDGTKIPSQIKYLDIAKNLLNWKVATNFQKWSQQNVPKDPTARVCYTYK